MYEWRVDPTVASEFYSWWHHGTLRIRGTCRGALGSTLLRSQDDPGVVVGVARWESVDALQDFRQAAGPLSFEGARLESMQIYDEIDDLTD